MLLSFCAIGELGSTSFPHPFQGIRCGESTVDIRHTRVGDPRFIQPGNPVVGPASKQVQRTEPEIPKKGWRVARTEAYRLLDKTCGFIDGSPDLELAPANLVKRPGHPASVSANLAIASAEDGSSANARS